MTTPQTPVESGSARPSHLVALDKAIEAVNAECRRLMPKSVHDIQLATAAQILATTPEQGTDLATAIRNAMFGDGYQLSHERRLLAITLSRALPELTTLRAKQAEDAADAEQWRSFFGEDPGRLTGADSHAWRLRDALVRALQDAWDTICSDSDCYPECIRNEGRGFLSANFDRSNFVLYAAESLRESIRVARSAPVLARDGTNAG